MRIVYNELSEEAKNALWRVYLILTEGVTVADSEAGKHKESATDMSTATEIAALNDSTARRIDAQMQKEGETRES
jgi:hypothetical protein